MGYKIGAEPKSIVYHVGGGTLAYENPRKTYLNHRNSLFMIYKNVPKGILKQVFIRLCLDGVAGLKYLLSGKASHFVSVLKAHKDFYFSLSKLKKKRSLQQQSLPNTISDISIVKEAFINKTTKYSELGLQKVEQSKSVTV